MNNPTKAGFLVFSKKVTAGNAGQKFVFFLLALFFLSGCITIRQSQVGVKRRLGKVNPMVLDQGLRFYNPFLTVITVMPTNTINREVSLNLPSKEGLTIRAEISILYRIDRRMAPKIFDEIGLGYERVLIDPVFRSAASDVSSKFFAKDMHSGERNTIESNIRDTMMRVLSPRGFVIENVLMKSITLPQDLSRAIEEKLRAEQEAQRMEFVKQREQMEAERKAIAAEGDQKSEIINAEGQRKVAEIRAMGNANALKIEMQARAEANEMISKSLTTQVLQYFQIEAFRTLSSSLNSKIIITDGKTPLLGIPTN
jgi:regulator of protease activity HflC (stomatin/prohibitin superfamily)